MTCQNFLDYGDAGEYRERIEEVRRDFADLKTGKEHENAAAPATK